MTQRQQYAVVPTSPDMGMLDAAYIPRATGKDSLTIYKAMLEAAPPPPEQVLSKTDIARIFRDIYGGNRYGESELLFAQAIERAVLKQLGAKNV